MHSRIDSLPIKDLRIRGIKEVQLLHMDFIEVECFRFECRLRAKLFGEGY